MIIPHSIIYHYKKAKKSFLQCKVHKGSWFSWGSSLMVLSLDFTVIRSSLVFLSDRLFFFRVVSKRFFSRVISTIFPACSSFCITTSCLFLFLWLEGEETLKYCCVCRPPYGKFNVVTNDHGHIQKCYFSVLDR